MRKYWLRLEGQVKPSLTPFCWFTGAKRNAHLGPSASNAHRVVTATMEDSVHRALGPVSVSSATRAPAARSACVLRACMALAAACHVPAMPTTPSGRRWGNVGGTGVGCRNPSPAQIPHLLHCHLGSALTVTSTGEKRAVLSLPKPPTQGSLFHGTRNVLA